MAISAAREAVLQQAADHLLTARRTATPIHSLPEAVAPTTEEESFAIQDILALAYAPIGGWKVGAQSPEGVPFFCPLPAAWMGANGAVFRGMTHRLRGIEAEIAFRVGTALPPRATPYTREEVIVAMDGAYPAIEVLESSYVNPLAMPREHMLADLAIHGGFVAGPRIPDWQEIDWSQEHVVVTTDGVVRIENTGSNPGGTDLVRLLVYLANEGSTRTGGLKAGDWITTGSWTGVTWTSEGTEVVARFNNAGAVSLQFERTTH
ncbi:2-keto-4-pentenoate hydratase [Terriglobus roseus]|uniref:2-keto-4-pentenoate hydratase n=1 Tax=Terriglobus roseus TaxID=392734 RepID=A0A1G7K6J2_9BACT|nr:2-keto-4-pentenoate hydratase [Terriglobus roseus]SDF32469.1 2-keto-4-pentenoate hydratase [Terriglobus roseus]